MRAGQKISVVAVNLNEENTIGQVLENIPADIDEVVVVDGFSTDKSPHIARSLGHRVIMQEGKGRGSAFTTGFKHVTGDIIVMLSTDGNERSVDIHSLVNKMLQGYDLVIASRFGPGKSHDATLIRHFGNWFFTALINTVAGTQLYDTQNGFRAIRKEALHKINIDATSFDIEAEITLKAGKLGLRIAEVPTIEDKRMYGESHLRTFRDGWKIFKRIIKETKRNPPYVDKKNL